MFKLKKKKLPKVPPSITEVFPIVDYTEHNAFLTSSGTMIDFFKISTRDLNSAKDYDIEFDIANFTKTYRSYKGDIKLITMYYPVDTTSQQHFVDTVMERMANPVCQKDLQTEKEVLLETHRSFHEREFYLMYFAKNETDYKDKKNQLKSYLKSYGLLQEITLAKKLQIVYKMNNPNCNIAYNRLNFIPREIPKGYSYNPYLVSAIQPQGNISFKEERYAKTGTGYTACIHVYDYTSTVSFNWLSDITLFEGSITTVDISSSNKQQTIQNINRSMEEQLSRIYDARYQTEKMDANDIYDQLQQVYAEMNRFGEVMKVIHNRIYVSDTTVGGLEKRCAEIISEIESRGYKAAIFLEENLFEYHSMFLSFSQQKRLPNSRKGKPIPAEAFAIGHPYHYSSLNDPYGLYLGYTKTGGSVIYDKYHKDLSRLSYCSVVVGNMGAGKSTILKKLMKQDIIQGNVLRGFVTNNEFNKLAFRYGGRLISLDGSEGILNVFQVYKTTESESQSFLKHIAKICTFYKFLLPEMDTYLKAELQKLVKSLYLKHMGYDTEQDSTMQITGKASEEYPIAEDFLQLIREDIYSDFEKKTPRGDISEEHFKRVEKLELITESLVTVYGAVFNGHSSIPDFSKEQIVLFNVADLKNGDAQVFDAQVFSAMSLLWDNLLSIGIPMKEAFESGQKQICDVTKYMIYMDEAHNFINARKITALEFLSGYVRESRKYFGGIMLASQSIRDFIPEGSNQTGIDLIKTLFTLSQYKFIFKQDAECYDTLRMAFRGELPDNDLEEIPKFEQGECVLIICGMLSLRMNVAISEEELGLFSGGA